MRILHFVQPRRCTRPSWSFADQSSDAPLAAIARIAHERNQPSDLTVVFGGTSANLDAGRFGLRVVAHAPVCGHSLLGLRRLRELPSALNRNDVLIGWGLQFTKVLDRIAPRSNAIVIDLNSGVAHVRSLMQSAWHTLAPLPARLRSTPPPTPRRITSRHSGNPITIGLCRDGPSADPVSAYTFAMGGVAVSGFEIDAVVSRDLAEIRRLQRHTREGGRLHKLRTINGPLVLSGAEADLWIYALTSKSGVVATDHTDWATMLTADALAEQGIPVLAALPKSAQFCPTIAPRTMLADSNALSDVSSHISGWIHGAELPLHPFETTDLCTRLLRIAEGISTQEPILSFESWINSK